MANVKKVKKRKLNVKGLILLLLILYLIIMFLYTIFTMPIKNIYIKNTSLITDNEIIEFANIKDYPSMFRINTKKLEKKISSLELVEYVEVKKTLTGKLIINIKETVPLFYNRNTNKVVLSNESEVDNNSKYLGIPTLINYVPSDLLSGFIQAFRKVNVDIINMINEIEYDPHIEYDEETGKNIVYDSKRFLIRMNDMNTVYVNTPFMDRLNDYKSIIMTIGDERGLVSLDSDNSDNGLLGLFTSYNDLLQEDIQTGEFDGESDGED